MSVLNIKNFPDDLYEKLKEQAEADRRSISQEVVFLLEQSLVNKSRSITELRGLGKKYWQKVNVSTFIDEERGSWD